jgi:hypothetical protein
MALNKGRGMGIDVRLEDEDGNETSVVFDPTFLVEKLLPPFEDESSYCLRFIDPYGDTVFNSLQMPIFIKELEQAIEETSENDVKSIGQKILKLATECQKDDHQYLKFYGD